MQAKGRQRLRRSIYSDNSYPNIRRKFSVSEFFCPVNSKKSDACAGAFSRERVLFVIGCETIKALNIRRFRWSGKHRMWGCNLNYSEPSMLGSEIVFKIVVKLYFEFIC